ncbi:alpha-rhamnosidase [Hymenobacter sp. BT186]|uniref:Alpha-rhamnosidase n=1 Tax=Hymenobacter telluris TaxID=2816474 RepID=A0A939EUF2_9BACT|nr:alpha-rhamnosidase [Hymenobacter telluris]MBO0356677.1 alpha-rhamnosidase [Hymenobacter telluris]MBW3372702.1 alpha-rhamnosidase [Hymenobacter norwichensis]
MKENNNHTVTNTPGTPSPFRRGGRGVRPLVWAFLLLLTIPAEAQQAAKATWIWYPGDYEIWLSNQMQNRRTERGTFFPPFWRLDSHYPLIDFHQDFELKAPEEVELRAEGQYNVKLDGKLLSGSPTRLTVPAGKHRLNIKVYNQANVPTVFVRGKTIGTDGSWLVTYEDKEWIDASGKVSDQSGTTWLTAGSWNFNEAQALPSAFKLRTEPQRAASVTRTAGGGLLVDFGRETFGYVRLHGLQGKGQTTLYFGESKEEALSTEGCETLERLDVNQPQKGEKLTSLSKAFRFVNIQPEAGVTLDSVSMLYEYAPVVERGRFRCSDDQLNKIWDVAAYTMHLNTREFFIDGIKRDRWVWSGDAYQSYLMNYYLYFDTPTVNRTTFALRGKDPVTSHVNTIMDYTFYWFIGIYDAYQYTGDKTVVTQLYPRMQSLMDYCLARRNKDGLMEGLAGDWVFIDWADGLSKKGEVSFEQLLLCRSLESMALCANLVNDQAGAQKYQQLATDLKAKIFATYWNQNKGALVHSCVNGQPTDNVTRYANMFAIFFDYLNNEQEQQVKKSVLLNPQVAKITTPYMRFYELEALCALGEQPYVLKEMKSYWGGMLNEGATSFWEEYDPAKKGTEHLSMYGRPFGKSLCHAWGASPIYLLGKYYLGVKPLSAGYATYEVVPNLGGLQWMEGAVPTPQGDISVRATPKQLKVKGAVGTGTLRFASKTKPSCKGAKIQAKGNGQYELQLEKGREYVVTYQAV